MTHPTCAIGLVNALLLLGPLAAQEPARSTVDLDSVLAWDHSGMDVESRPEVVVEAELALTSNLASLPGGQPLATDRIPSTGPGTFPLAGLLAGREGGVYRIWARVRDASANWSDWSEPLEVEFDIPPMLSFRRADANDDNRVDIADAISSLSAIFLGGQLSCRDAADANDDGRLDIADPVTTLDKLFLGKVEIPAPGIDGCGPDPTEDALGCESFTACDQNA